MTPFFRFLTYACAGYALFSGIMFVAQRRMMYHPDTSTPNLDQAGVSDMAAVTVTTADGLNLTAWHRPPTRDGAPTLVYFHGNAGHIGHRGSKARPYLDAGYGVMLASWRGYGGNPGSPTEDGFYDDARAALDFLAAAGVPANRVVVYGESIGSGPAVQVATERDIGALVLEAPLTSAANVAQRHYWYLPAQYLVLDRFNSIAKLDRIEAPLFIVHGGRDSVVPIDMSHSLLAAAAEPKDAQFFPGATHNDLYDHGADDAIIAFLEKMFF
ncbi:MAG: alpha/beta hydrolase [Pseudomonadota bacterium]|nr:alpha/beta hydrolase [Pseudomonadota bacterium]